MFRNILVSYCTFDYVSELKSTQFREGKELQNKGIRGSQ